jgi:parallel beta-helix repeat protein
MTRLLLLAAAGVGAGAEWDVYPGAGTPIQTAINSAGDGDAIYVHAGTYVENVDVNKRLTLIGDGADVVNVTAASSSDHVFNVTADYVNISGFTMTGTRVWPNAGVYLGDCVGHCNISNNTVLGNSRGIGMHHSSNNVLTNNIVNSNDWYGIYLRYSSNNTLTNNTANSNYNIYQGFAFGIYLHKSCNNTLQSNTANSNDIGIYLGYSSDNILQSNTANLNYYGGIELDQCSNNNTLQESIANSNTWKGICLSSSSDDNTLTNNIVNSNNYYGICLEGSSNNTLYRNNLANNTRHNAHDTGTNNTWDSSSEGNYYSDYTGSDNNTDGIGDDPYDIPGGDSIDRYPLMHPWSGNTPQKGDLNSDDQITPTDAAIALRLVSGAHDNAADVSRDGHVTSLDVLMILQAAAGAIEL